MARLSRVASSLLLAALLLVPLAAIAETRLVMVTSDHCPFCRAWERDVGAIYDKSPYAPNMPLTRVEMGAPLPDDIVLTEPVIGTPTFLIVSEGREVDRQRGYDDAEMFWWWLSGHVPE
ncbi:MAG: thioredoxin family protein [Rhodobiaceae bacterium]